jgi:hypothetical protein
MQRHRLVGPIRFFQVRQKKEEENCDGISQTSSREEINSLYCYSKKHNSKIYSVNKMMNFKNKRDLIYFHCNRIIFFEFKNNTTHINDSLKYINDRDYLCCLINA